jgi:hypothetical protein
MGEIAAVTAGTTAGTAQAATRVAGLAQLATDLRHSVATFRLPDHDDATVDPAFVDAGFEEEPLLPASLTATSN